jgi:uncharacterized membrane protein
MLPDPLHPAVVHLPIALALIVPLLAGLSVATIRSRLVPRRIWGGVLLLQACLVGSTWFALETGHQEEERVEVVVPERFIEEHEGAAERFWVASIVTLVLAGGGLLRGPGQAFRPSFLINYLHN